MFSSYDVSSVRLMVMYWLDSCYLVYTVLTLFHSRYWMSYQLENANMNVLYLILLLNFTVFYMVRPFCFTGAESVRWWAATLSDHPVFGHASRRLFDRWTLCLPWFRAAFALRKSHQTVYNAREEDSLRGRTRFYHGHLPCRSSCRLWGHSGCPRCGH